MKETNAICAGSGTSRSESRVVLLDPAAERQWMDESPSGQCIRCAPGNWSHADEWFARALGSRETARHCQEWAAARLGIRAPVSEFLLPRFAERLLAHSNQVPAAKLCIQVLGWGTPANLDRVECWQGFAELTPASLLPRIIVENESVLEEADRIAMASVPIGLRMDRREWERFLSGNDWSRHAARWRFAPVRSLFRVSSSESGAAEGSSELRVPGSELGGTRRLVAAWAPEALMQLEAAGASLEKEAASGGGHGEARSAAEALLFSVLDARPLTRGRFCLNAALGFKFGTRLAEGDLVDLNAKLVIEIDGYFHFRDSDCYRRDRRKDAALQEHGWFVLRFLASDIVRDLEGVLARIDAHLARLLL